MIANSINPKMTFGEQLAIESERKRLEEEAKKNGDWAKVTAFEAALSKKKVVTQS